MADTGKAVSALAGQYAHLSTDELFALAYSTKSREKLAADIRAMAASLLRQDEVKPITGKKGGKS